MSKYSEEFKLKVVLEYKKGFMGYILLANKYNISTESIIRRWVANYDAFGIEGLKRIKKNNNYTTQFKLDVINYRKQTSSSLKETALHFGIINYATITAWEKKLKSEGVSGLSKVKGRPSMKKKTNQLISTEVDEVEALKIELELVKEERDRAKLENLYLKKLKAYLEDPKNYSDKGKSK